MLILVTTVEAAGHITLTNSFRSISPSLLVSPMAKMASISIALNLLPHDLISSWLMRPSPSLSRILNICWASAMFLTFLVKRAMAMLAAGHIRLTNSSRSMSPSWLMSPTMKIASVSCALNLPHPAISCLLSMPSWSLSIARKAFLTSDMFLYLPISLETTVRAEGHMTAMNSSRSMAPSSLMSPRAKMAST